MSLFIHSCSSCFSFWYHIQTLLEETPGMTTEESPAVSPQPPFQHPPEHETDIQVCTGVLSSSQGSESQETLCRPTGRVAAGAEKPCAVSRSWPPAQESSTCYINIEPPPEPALVRPQPTACQQHWPSLGTNPKCAHAICICWAVLARSPSRSVGSGWEPSESWISGCAQAGPC